MGESVKIVDLAKNMIRLSGRELGKDIDIKFTGLRPGEKLYEELLNKEENTIPTHHPKILKAKERANDIDLSANLMKLETEIALQENASLVRILKKMVPEFISNNSEFTTLDKKQ
jgi:FlaA1/EpsC-like NDP-sugar epimerase